MKQRWTPLSHIWGASGTVGGLSDKSLFFFDCVTILQLPIGHVLATVKRWVKIDRVRGRRDGMAYANMRSGLSPKECISRRA